MNSSVGNPVCGYMWIRLAVRSLISIFISFTPGVDGRRERVGSNSFVLFYGRRERTHMARSGVDWRRKDVDGKMRPACFRDGESKTLDRFLDLIYSSERIDDFGRFHGFGTERCDKARSGRTGFHCLNESKLHLASDLRSTLSGA